MRSVRSSGSTSMNRLVAVGSLRVVSMPVALSSLRDADKGKLWSARFVVRRRSELENADSSESNDSDWTNLQVSSKSVSRAIPVLRYEDAFLSPLFPVPMMPRLAVRKFQYPTIGYG
ncbi:hypothetical protein CABS03_06635 [Colletotrichum abscissum]|uniref:Uncharacterized protein n=1 Tax=Colletotrichum abscissum TaxID=1671311 RepID=A0A9Q0AZS3_9PEZI|nr:hypothetical protein CABS02_11946 [Colletotrichum abscissum]